MGQKAHDRDRARKGRQPRLIAAQLIVRCFAEQKGEFWQAFCLDFNLAVQGNSYQEVRQKLHDQIKLYLDDIFNGPDRKYAHQLLNRRAPLEIRVRYHLCRLFHKANAAKDGITKIFTEVLPFTMANNHAA